jgi:alpha-beta hydrolase superfamily lysophospholipase
LYKFNQKECRGLFTFKVFSKFEKIDAMKITDYQWKSSNRSVYGATWTPENDPKGVIVFVHGIGEHCRRYDEWFAHFCEMGLAVISGDHHGHGRSEGKRGHFNSYYEPLDFVTMLFEKADEFFPHLPKLMYGHSMGGNITLNYLLRKNPKVKGAIVSSPWVILRNPPSKLLLTFARLVDAVYPSYTQHSGIKRDQLTSNQEELEKYDKDELLHGKITVRTYFELDAAANFAKANIQKLQVPLLLMHGTADPIASPEGSKFLAEKNSKFIELRLFDGFLHEIHKEKERNQPMEAIKAHIKKLL